MTLLDLLTLLSYIALNVDILLQIKTYLPHKVVS